MRRSSPLVEIHYALWAVLTVPIGFAGLFFILPGLIFGIGIALEVIAGVLIVYIAQLTRGSRGAWLFGLLMHAAVALGAVYYIPRWPAALAVPLLLANLYSLFVLVIYRPLWTATDRPATQPA